MTKNFIRTQGLPWRAHYLYLDCEPWAADRIFIGHELRVHFKSSFTREGFGYSVVECWVRRKDADEFETCMEELLRASLLKGRGDYADACRELEWLFEGEG